MSHHLDTTTCTIYVTARCHHPIHPIILSLMSTVFCGPSVKVDHISPLQMPGMIWLQGLLTVLPFTELQMWYWHLLNPMEPRLDLLNCCLTKGLPYHISLSVDSLNPPCNSTSISAFDSSMNLISQGQNEMVSTAMVEQYLANVQTVLNYPHACKLLHHGGILWCIVRQHTPYVYINALMDALADVCVHRCHQHFGWTNI